MNLTSISSLNIPSIHPTSRQYTPNKISPIHQHPPPHSHEQFRLHSQGVICSTFLAVVGELRTPFISKNRFQIDPQLLFPFHHSQTNDTERAGRREKWLLPRHPQCASQQIDKMGSQLRIWSFGNQGICPIGGSRCFGEDSRCTRKWWRRSCRRSMEMGLVWYGGEEGGMWRES